MSGIMLHPPSSRYGARSKPWGLASKIAGRARTPIQMALTGLYEAKYGRPARRGGVSAGREPHAQRNYYRDRSMKLTIFTLSAVIIAGAPFAQAQDNSTPAPEASAPRKTESSTSDPSVSITTEKKSATPAPKPKPSSSPVATKSPSPEPK